MYLPGFTHVKHRRNLATCNQSCTVHYRPSSYITARNNCPENVTLSCTIMTWCWSLTISTHHVPFAASNVTKIVVPLLSKDGWATHERDNLLVFSAPGVLQIPELDMSEKKNYILEIILKICLSPVSRRDKVGPILRKANCLHLCRDFVAGDLEQSPFIEIHVVIWLLQETWGLELDNVPRRYSQHHLFPKPRNLIYSPPSDLMSMDPILTPPGDESQSLCWKCFGKLHISSRDNDDGEMTPFQHPPLHSNHQHNHHQHPLRVIYPSMHLLVHGSWLLLTGS